MVDYYGWFISSRNGLGDVTPLCAIMKESEYLELESCNIPMCRGKKQYLFMALQNRIHFNH